MLLSTVPPLAGFPNASQEDLKIEKTAKDTQKGLEKSFQNVTPDTSDLPNPFDGVGAGSVADKVCISFACLSLQPSWDDSCVCGAALVKGSCFGFLSVMALALMMLLPGTKENLDSIHQMSYPVPLTRASPTL